MGTPEPDFRTPSRHLTRSSPGLGVHPQGPAVQSRQGLSGFGQLQPDKGGKKAEVGAVSRAGRALSTGQQRSTGGRQGEYCLYRAGDCGGLDFRARLSMEPGGWSPRESELPDRDPGLEMS